MSNQLFNLAMQMLPSEEFAATYKDKLAMYDNLNTPMVIAFTDKVRAFLAGLPMRMSFTVAIACFNGEIRMRCNLQDYVIGKGEFITVVPKTIVESIYLSPDCTLIMLSFSDDTFTKSLSFYNYAFAKTRLVHPVKVPFSTDITEAFKDAYKHLVGILNRYPAEVEEELVKAYVQVLFGLVSMSRKDWEQTHAKEAPASAGEKVLKQFLAHLAEDYTVYRDVAHYAERAGLSPKYFAKVIYTNSGRHPADWIQDHVILDAKTMLRSGESIQHICQVLHFGSQSHFARYFKAATGVSPMRYRNREK